MALRKKEIKKCMDKTDLVLNHSNAMRELAERSLLRDRLNSTVQMEARTSSMEAARTLDSIEARVSIVNEKAKQHKMRVS